MRKFKKLKFVLPSLVFVPLAAGGAFLASCANTKEDFGPEAKKVTVYLDDKELLNQTEFDIVTTKKLQLSAKVEPAEASQDVTFEILAQEGTGNIACSATGIIYTNGCVGTITIRAVSKDKKAKSDPIELIFWDSKSIVFQVVETEIVPKHPIKGTFVTISPGYANSIEDLVIPSKCTIDGKQYDVNGIGYSGFNGCGKLRYLRFPEASEKFLYIGTYAFYSCDLLKKITLPDSVLLIDRGAFCNCTGLENISLGKNLIYLCSNSFENCTNLLSLEMPESIAYIGDSAFAECHKITNFYIPKSVEVIGESAFANCWKSTISVDPDSNYFWANETALYNKNKTRLLTCQYGYVSNQNLYTFSIPDSVEKIDARAFEYCEKIETINFGINSKCESIGEEAFALCRNLHNVNNLPNKLTEIKTATFACCWELEGLEIPSSVEYIGKHAFYGCDVLNWIRFKKEDTSSVDEPITWTIIGDSVQPILNEKNYDVKCHETEEEKIKAFEYDLAYSLAMYGHWLDPEAKEEDREWVGGHANCVWLKNSIPVNFVPLPGSQITYKGFESINKGAKQFKMKFDLESAANNLKLDLVNVEGDSILATGAVEFTGAAGTTKEIEVQIGENALSNIDHVVIKITN